MDHTSYPLEPDPTPDEFRPESTDLDALIAGGDPDLRGVDPETVVDDEDIDPEAVIDETDVDPDITGQDPDIVPEP
jgi:hypothetical protein